MGQQQYLIIAAGIVIISLMIAVGYSVFVTSEIEAEKLAIVNEMMTLAGAANLYRERPARLGGGDGSYHGFRPPAELLDTEHADLQFTASGLTASIKGMSKRAPENLVTATLTAQGLTADWRYSGDFGC